jgi:tRNA-guanine family transglycosylase
MSKLFITWYAEPEDPHYWKYFPVEGIVVSLKSVLSIPKWKLSRILLDGFKRYFGFRGTLIVDSFTTWLHTRVGFSTDLPQYHVLYLQYLLGSDVLVQKDYPFIGDMNKESRERMFKKNLVNAEAALKIGERLGREVMLVVQGWDVNSYVKCAEFYRRLGAKYVGIGSLVPRSNDVKFIERVVKEVRAVLGRSVWLHLFGVANIDVLKRVAKYVDSVDVSTPTLAAAKKEMIVWKDGRFLRLKTTSLTNISSLGQLIEETADAFEKELLTKILDAKTISEKNRLLMIYNTYVLQKYINRFI